jgi:geranylgeranyl diphosphate synthase, type I
VPLDLRGRVERALRDVLEERRRAIEAGDPAAVALVDEIGRLLDAGGKRVRPLFCYWGYRAAGGADDGTAGAPIVRAAGALELLHTMALVHDDLLDGAKERRGVPTTAVWFAQHAGDLGLRGDPQDVGTRVAVLVGDLAAVLADEMLLGSGFGPEALVRAQAVYHEMRERMAAGEYLDVAGRDGDDDPAVARRAASLKGGAYTVEGPVLIGAALAGASDRCGRALAAYGRPLGEAFQLADDLRDGEASPGVSPDTVTELVGLAKAALGDPAIPAEAAEALGRLADSVSV